MDEEVIVKRPRAIGMVPILVPPRDASNFVAVRRRFE
jgi:hypothetical protein